MNERDRGKNMGELRKRCQSGFEHWQGAKYLMCVRVCSQSQALTPHNTHRRRIRFLSLYSHALVLTSLAALFWWVPWAAFGRDDGLSHIPSYPSTNTDRGARLRPSAFPIGSWWDDIHNYRSQKPQLWCAGVKRMERARWSRCCQLRSCSITGLPLSA